jgi:hypothetical protein
MHNTNSVWNLTFLTNFLYEPTNYWSDSNQSIAGTFLVDFYFPHMKYGKYWFHLQIFFFFIANFYILGLFIPKKRV